MFKKLKSLFTRKVNKPKPSVNGFLSWVMDQPDDVKISVDRVTSCFIGKYLATTTSDVNFTNLMKLYSSLTRNIDPAKEEYVMFLWVGSYRRPLMTFAEFKQRLMRAGLIHINTTA